MNKEEYNKQWNKIGKRFDSAKRLAEKYNRRVTEQIEIMKECVKALEEMQKKGWDK